MYSERGFHFDVIKNNESGKPSTDEETLTNLRLTVKNPDSPKAIFLDRLLELRGLEKMYKTYIYGWWEKVQDDSRLHGRYNIHGTDSNRFSSADPNMQQIPKTTVDPNIKKQLVAPPGYLYMAFDYSQAELRMMAHLSGDETYLEAFAKAIADIARSHGMSMATCAEVVDLEKCGIEYNCCIDKKLIEEIIGCDIKVAKDKSQRPECGCMDSVEIGSYNTCLNGCKYCYANYSPDAVKANCKCYDPASPLLCGSVGEYDKITERKVKSLKQTQLSFRFDGQE
jgi:hypothetical protein